VAPCGAARSAGRAGWYWRRAAYVRAGSALKRVGTYLDANRAAVTTVEALANAIRQCFRTRGAWQSPVAQISHPAAFLQIANSAIFDEGARRA
jgi:hypothetical protein